ncbi:AAA family ATPase [Acinetobacter pittii]|uniref:McrB family protein n=1 Tax=Acinetobacter pittii TaxID=48296 RepID=UPI0023427AD3|nr:AAA family ATPase [Acinetobacter baumannii]
MFLSLDVVAKAYRGLVRIDSSDGKSRKERVSAMRHFLATDQLMKESGLSEIDLSVGSSFRDQFVESVGRVVAFNNTKKYTKDFALEIDEKKDYAVGSNFFTTRLSASRTQVIEYPGRPKPLLELNKEKVKILPNAYQVLLNDYGVSIVKLELVIWLLRDYDFENIDLQNLDENQFQQHLESALGNKFSSNLLSIFTLDLSQVAKFMSEIGGDLFADKEADICTFLEGIVSKTKEDTSTEKPLVLENTLDDSDEIYTTTIKLLNRGAKSILFSGPPGTGKTWHATKIALKLVDHDLDKIERVQFHPSYTYEDFIEGMVSVIDTGSTVPIFQPKNKVFLKLCEKARDDKESLYILIIDEFTRGDPSKIFGELLTYIEPDYRDVSFTLTFSEKEVSVPQNILIFATMNPYDKSVVDLDAAMERRFDIIEVLPDFKFLESVLRKNSLLDEKIDKVVSFFHLINDLAPHGFGHSYFKEIASDEDFILLWNHRLKFIIRKMFKFEIEKYENLRAAYLEILSPDNKKLLT